MVSLDFSLKFGKNSSKALFRYTQNKTLQNSSSHRILRHRHEVLNIDKKIINCTVYM